MSFFYSFGFGGSGAGWVLCPLLLNIPRGGALFVNKLFGARDDVGVGGGAGADEGLRKDGTGLAPGVVVDVVDGVAAASVLPMLAKNAAGAVLVELAK